MICPSQKESKRELIHKTLKEGKKHGFISKGNKQKLV